MDYAQHYGFSRMPFGEDADREVLFPSETHKEALASVLYGIRERKGYIVVIGERGMGKTHLARQAMGRLDEGVQAVLISDAHDRYYMLLKELTGKLGIRTAESSKGPLLHALYEYLIRCLEKGGNVVLFLDDAHRMKDEIVEELRLMSNLETSRTKLIQIVILAEPELDQRLGAQHMRQIRQRIQILHRLLPFSEDESRQYIEHRLAWAGGAPEVLTAEAMTALCRHGGGIPHTLNILCDGALALGQERSENPVSAQTVRDAHRAAAPLLRREEGAFRAAPARKSASPGPWVCAATAAVIAGLSLGGYYYYAERKAAVSQRGAVATATVAAGAPAAAPPARTQAPAPAVQPQGPEKAPAPEARGPAHPAPVSTRGPAAPEPEDSETVVKRVVVSEGATLTSIAARHYGSADATALDHILESNPEITDVDLILTGSEVALPRAAGKARIVTRPDGSLAVHAATFMTQREARDFAVKAGSGPGKIEIVKRNVGPRKDWYRVVSGPFGSREEARAALESTGSAR